MYCKNCGNELNENDKFCNKCGFKISSDFQENSPLSTHNNKLTKIKKYFIAIIFFIAFPIVLYSISLPENISIVDFITDPRGLTAVVSSTVGSAAGTLIFFLPLLYGMKKIKITKRTYISEAFFIITILYEMVIWLLGDQAIGVIVKTITPVILPAFTGGIIMIVFALFKIK